MGFLNPIFENQKETRVDHDKEPVFLIYVLWSSQGYLLNAGPLCSPAISFMKSLHASP